MRVIIALGGNALLERGEAPNSDIQETHVVSAVTALAPLAGQHQLLITHGNGPQVGVLALESARDPALSHPYPFDVLGAQTQGMIGYWLVQALRGAVPGQPAGCLLSRTVVRADDPAFGDPTKFVGPVYDEARARQLAAERGWDVRQDGTAWRRVVPSPEPVELVELEMIKLLAGSGAIVVCAGGGGVPVVRDDTGALRGVEAVVDKDLTAALLARDMAADALVILDRRGRGRGRLRHPARPAHPPGHPPGAARPPVPGRVHGPEGGSRLPLRGGDRRDGRDRPPRRRRGAPGRQGRHDRGARRIRHPVNGNPDGRTTYPPAGSWTGHQRAVEVLSLRAHGVPSGGPPYPADPAAPEYSILAERAGFDPLRIIIAGPCQTHVLSPVLPTKSLPLVR